MRPIEKRKAQPAATEYILSLQRKIAEESSRDMMAAYQAVARQGKKRRKKGEKHEKRTRSR